MTFIFFIIARWTFLNYTLLKISIWAFHYNFPSLYFLYFLSISYTIIGFASALTYDFEVFSTAQDRWLEISSVSNFETFQANRLKLRYKDANGKNQLAHTLNGSSLALPRVLAGILENYQTPEGIVIPEVLRKYTGFDIID
jgi:seryl-tRNA synthetase